MFAQAGCDGRVITDPDGRAYVAAVFTRAHRPGSEHAVNAVIGAAAAAAITALT